MALKKTVPTVKILILCVCVCGGGGVGTKWVPIKGPWHRGRWPHSPSVGPTPCTHKYRHTYTHFPWGHPNQMLQTRLHTDVIPCYSQSDDISCARTHTLNIHTPSLLGQPQAHALISPFIVKHTHADSLKITYNYTNSNGAQVLL